MLVVEVLFQIRLASELGIAQLTHIISFLVSFHVAPQAEGFHGLMAFFTLCSSLHPHPVLDLLVIDHTVLGEELQAADAAVAGEALQGQLGHVCIQGILVFLGEVHLERNIDEM